MKKMTFEYVNEFIKNSGEELLSITYYNCSSPLIIKCKNNHIRASCWTYIKSGIKCNFCYKQNHITQEIIENVVTTKLGILLTPYIKSKIPLKIKCSNNHEWETKAYNIVKQNSWCPYCTIYYSEEICRLAFETIFNKKFPKFRSELLVGVLGRKLEIDGFNTELNIAFEHNGGQHYRESKYFNSKFQKNLAKNDKIKIKFCKDNNIKLVIIPQLHEHVKLKNLISFILNELKCQNFIYNFDCETKLDLSLIHKNDKYKKSFILANDIAKSKEGQCLSTEFINITFPMKWKCKNNHIWSAQLSRIKRGDWCKKCFELSKYRTNDYDLLKPSILQLYFEYKKTLDSISKLLHISSPTMSKLFKLWNIDPNIVKRSNYLLNNKKVKEIRNSKLCAKELSKLYNVNIRTIQDVLNNKTWIINNEKKI